jgi:hypothetical protein
MKFPSNIAAKESGRERRAALKQRPALKRSESLARWPELSALASALDAVWPEWPEWMCG